MDPFASLHVFAVYLGLVFMQFGRPGDTLFIWHTTKSNQSKNKFGVKLNFDSQHQFLLLKSHTTPQESAPPSKIWVLQRDEFTSTFFKTGKSSTSLEANDAVLLERFGTRNLSAFESLLPPSPVPVNTVDIIMTLGILAKMLENKRMGNPVPTLPFLQKYALLDVTNNFFAQLFPTEDGAYEKMKQFQKSFRWRQWEDVEDLDELLPNNSTVRLAVSSLSPWVISFYKDPDRFNRDELPKSFTIFNICSDEGVFESIHLLQAQLCTEESPQLAVHLLARTGICSVDLLELFSRFRRRQKELIHSIGRRQPGNERQNFVEQLRLLNVQVGSDNPCPREPTFILKNPLIPM
jgi:hypothetical protein